MQEYTYDGNFEKNAMDGKGKLSHSVKKYTYEGDFKENKFDGSGVKTWQDGRKYTGQFKNSKING